MALQVICPHCESFIRLDEEKCSTRSPHLYHLDIISQMCRKGFQHHVSISREHTVQVSTSCIACKKSFTAHFEYPPSIN